MSDYYFGLPDSSAGFPAGATVYAYVDSISYGNVKEGNEGNNLSQPVVSTAGVEGKEVSVVGTASREGLPA